MMSTRSRLRALAAAVVALGGGSALARHEDHHDAPAPAGTPGSSPTASTGTALVYLVITNTGSEPDRLVSAQTDVAHATSMHDNEGTGDVMRMAEVAGGFAIEPGATLELGPGGAHIMLENLRRDLHPGSTYRITLSFERAGKVTNPVTVSREAPVDTEPTILGSLELSAAWSLPAPMLGDGASAATPEGTPEHHH